MSITKPILTAIRLYQRTLSPDTGWFRARHPYGYCRFYPTCSEYAHQAIGRYGLFRGTGLSLLRIVRCNPWHQPGIDHLPTASPLTNNS